MQPARYMYHTGCIPSEDQGVMEKCTVHHVDCFFGCCLPFSLVGGWRVNEKLGLSTKDVNFIKIYIYIICGNLLLTTTYKFVLFIKKMNEN